MTVTLTVPSATTLDVTGCPASTLGSTDLGTVLHDQSVVSTSDCSVGFGSSNDTSSLRIAQSDGAGVAMWQPTRGNLDPSYGNAGIRTGSSAGDENIQTTVIFDDGVVESLGGCGSYPDQSWCGYREAADGTRDASFGGGRFEFNPTSGADDVISAAVAVENGDVIVAGECNDNLCAGRLRPDGTLDPSFGAGGWVSWPVNSGVAQLVQLTDGTMLASTNCGNVTCMARFRPEDGSLDTDFDGDGLMTVDLASSWDNVYGIAPRPDGSADVIFHCTSYVWCGVAVTAAGSLDGSFQHDGLSAPPAPIDSYEPGALTVRSDGTLLVGGDCYIAPPASTTVPCIIHLLGDGTIDSSFGSSGFAWQTNSAFGDTQTSAIAEADEGALLLASTCDFNYCIERFTDSGVIDPTFGTNGVAQFDIIPMECECSGDHPEVIRGLSDGEVAVEGSCTSVTWDNVTCGARLAGGGKLSNYDNSGGAGDTDFASDNTTSTFGACLHDLTPGATAVWAASSGCTAADSGDWNAVPATSTTIAKAPTSTTTTIAHLRFGMRSALTSPAGRYVAPIIFDVVAPAP